MTSTFGKTKFDKVQRACTLGVVFPGGATQFPTLSHTPQYFFHNTRKIHWQQQIFPTNWTQTHNVSQWRRYWLWYFSSDITLPSPHNQRDKTEDSQSIDCSVESSHTSPQVFGYYSRLIKNSRRVVRFQQRNGAHADDNVAVLTKHFYPCGPPSVYRAIVLGRLCHHFDKWLLFGRLRSLIVPANCYQKHVVDFPQRFPIMW